MKKLFLGACALMVLSVVSCKKTVEAAADEATEVVDGAADAAGAVVDGATDVVDGAADAVAEAASGIPSFEDAAVNEYVKAYDEYISEYAKAAESKDMTAFAALGTKGQELGTKAQEVLGNLSPEDAKKLTDYMTENSKKLQELSAKFSQ